MSRFSFYAAILVAVIVLTIVGILSRYRKCKSDEVLVVYGKTGDKKSAKLYHGGAAFVWPIIQGYSFLNMKPMQIDCKLTGAISKQNIRVDRAHYHHCGRKHRARSYAECSRTLTGTEYRSTTGTD